MQSLESICAAVQLSKFLRKHERRRKQQRVCEQDSRSTGRRRRRVGLFSISAHVATTLIVSIIVYTNTNNGTSGQSSSLAPTERQRPPDVIVLENGATTPVVSLDDFLRTQSEEEQEAEKLPARTPSPIQVETASAKSADKLHTAEDPKLPSLPASETNKSAKLAIVFTLPDKESRRDLDENETTTTTTAHQHERAASETGKHAAAAATTTAANQTVKPIPQHWQVRSLLNVTHDYPLAYSQIICGYVWPLMAALTLFTNLMIVFVLTQTDMRTPTNVVLTAIAIADIIPIVVPVPWFVYLFAMGNEKQVLYPPIACYFYQHSTRSISEIFYFLSTWLNVLLAIQDYLAACQPRLAKKYCQIRVVVLEIVLLTLLAFLLNLPQALKLVFKPVKFYYQGQLTWGCKALQAKWFKDLVGEYVALYDDIFTAIIVVFVDGGPAVLLITLTSLLIRQLHRQRIRGHLLMEQARTASKRRRERHRQQEYESSARVMIFVLLAFLAVKIPFATTYTLMIIQSRFEIHFVENLVDFQKAITLTDLVFVLSYPINFTIFCCCSKKFRHKCAQLLGECNQSTKMTRDRIMSSFPNSLNSDSFLSRRYSSSLAGAGGRLHRESSVSFILPDEQEAAAGGGVVGGGQNGDLQHHIKAAAASALGKEAAKVGKMRARKARHARNFSMPDLISKSSASMSSASTAAPKSRQSEEATLSPASSAELDVATNAAPSMSAARQQNQRCEGQRHFFAPEQKSASLDAATGSDANNHHSARPGEGINQLPAVPLMPSGQEFRRLLGEGSLCLECIMCYERLKRSSADQQMAAAHQQNQVEAVAYDGARRRSSGQVSADSSQFSWPPPPPLPPQPRSLASLKQQLFAHGDTAAAATTTSGVPQIITTTCESISEQQSQSGGSEPGASEEIAVEARNAGRVAQKSASVDNRQLQQQHGQLSRQLHMVSNESNLSQTTAGTMGEINTPFDWSQVSADGGRGQQQEQEQEPGAGRSPAAGMRFGEVGQFQWEARRRMELAAAALDSTAAAQQQQQHRHSRPGSACLSQASSAENAPAAAAALGSSSHRSNSQSGEMLQAIGNEFSEAGEQAKQRKRSRSRDNDFSDLALTASSSYLTRPHEISARAEATSSAPAEMGGGGASDGAHQRGRRRSTQPQEAQVKRDGYGDAGGSQEELSRRSYQQQQQDERTTLSEQATQPTGGGGELGKHKKRSRGRLSLSSKFDSRQRSLSLSNSNLSTLPNATGMLADVLVSVLFVGQDKKQQQQQQGKESSATTKAASSKSGQKKPKHTKSGK